MGKKVFIYDTTLRDGTQAEGISFSVEGKIRIAQKLDSLGVHYIEGGWPGSNPNSIEFFERISTIRLKKAKISAFGSTRHAKNRPAKDPNLKALLDTNTPVVTIFGKSWDLHVRVALRVPLETNLKMIGSSVAYLKSKGKEVIYDAEHFFNGFMANPDYAMASLKAAHEAGADCLCLCETNGGCIPSQVTEIMRHVRIAFPDAQLGIHTHNDAGCGIANALAAIDEGASHVQGTINGYGERCGNSNLIPIIANLELKMNRSTIGKAGVKRLTELSHFVDEMANQVPDVRAPYVGRTCFTHKGGIHVSAVLRNASTYEHIDPSLVGNRRRVLVSDQSGRANLAYKIYELGLNIDSNHPGLKVALQELKELEKKGYEFEGAEASFVLLLRRALGQVPKYFEEHSWRILNEKTRDESVVLGMVKIKVGNQEEHALAEGDGPFNALDVALRTSLHPYYPEIEDLRLIDYKVRVLDADQRTAATVRVLINYQYKDETWGTVGVSGNVIEASWHALIDSIVFYLFEKRKLKARTRKPAVSVAKSNNGVKKKKVTKKRTSGKKR